MTHDRATPPNGDPKSLYQTIVASSYYGLLGLHPSASVREIRQAYRDLSKQYHPDTTSLPQQVATQKFQQLNEAYATLSSPERRSLYDRKIGYSRVPVVQPMPTLNTPRSQPLRSSAYLDPTDRPLSPGELFALFILGVTFLACLVLAVTIGITKGEAVFQPVTTHVHPVEQVTLPSLVTDSEAAIAAPEVSAPAAIESEPSAAIKSEPPTSPEAPVEPTSIE